MSEASIFFIVVYILMFRSIYYRSYKAPIVGASIILIMFATLFMGYYGLWGHASFSGAIVITNLFSNLPIIGEPVVNWIWGDFSVGNLTLNRFLSLDYLIPFGFFAAVFVCLWVLQAVINPKTEGNTVPFHPYYTIKGLFGISLFMMFYLIFVFFAPDLFGEPDSYIVMNPLSTPVHIVPEWYLLPFYAILRVFTMDIGPLTAKLQGVIAMFMSIILLMVLPWLDRSKVKKAASSVRSSSSFSGYSSWTA